MQRGNHNVRRSSQIGGDLISARASRRGHGTHSVWTLNVRLLVWSVVIVMLTAPTLYAVRTVQVRRNAGILFERAEEAERNGDYNGSARTLFRYLQFRPDDGPARILLANVFDKTATTFAAKQRATELYYSALAYFPDNIELRARLAEMLLELERPRDAERECLRILLGSVDPRRIEVIAAVERYQDRLHREKALSSNSAAAKSLEILAKACFESSQSERGWSAADQLTIIKSALAANPESIELVSLEARVYRERLTEPSTEERMRLADELMAKMAAEHPNAGQANLVWYQYCLRFDLPDADSALEKAYAAAPSDIEVLLAVAERKQSQGQLDDALACFTQAIELVHNDPRTYVGKAQTLFGQKKPEDAIKVCKTGLKHCGDDQVALSLLLVQGLIQSHDMAEANTVLTRLKHQQEKIGPLLKPAERTQLRDTIASLDAEVAIGNRQLASAVKILRPLTLVRSGEKQYADDLNARRKHLTRLAEVFQQLEYWETAAKAYDEAASLTTANYEESCAAGRSWQLAGRLDAAVASLETAVRSTNAEPQGWILLARAEMARQLRLAERNWNKAEHALSEAKRMLGKSPAVAILSVEVLKAMGNQSGALEALTQAVETHPAEVMPFAVVFYQTLGQEEQATLVLDRLKATKTPSDREVRVLEVELHRRRKDYEICLAILNGLLTDSSSEDRYNLQRQIVSIDLERGTPTAEQKLVALTKEYPDKLWAFERLADLALTKRDFRQLAEREKSLEKLEGSDGAFWRFYRAMRLLNDAQTVGDNRFDQAVRLQSELQYIRPYWAGTLQLKGRIAQQEGRVEDAAEAYKAAIETGATSVTVFEGLVSLLYANNRWLEADAFLSRLQQVGYQSPLLESFSSRMHLRQGEFGEALAAAQSGVTLRPQDPLAHIWLGQTLVLAASRESDLTKTQSLGKNAEASFQRAVEIAPNDFRTWSGLLWCNARIGDRQGALRALKGLRSQAKLTEPQRCLALAQAYQLLGDFRSAEEQLLQAAQLLPRDPATQESLAQFYLHYSPEKAEPAFRRLLGIAPNSKAARRTLATLLVTQGGESQFDEAVKLVRESGEESTDRRLQALLLMQRGGKENLANVRKLLTGLIQEAVSPNPSDRQLLALAAETDGDLVVAREQFERAAKETENPSTLVSLIEFLLRHGLQDVAADHVVHLATQEPDTLRTLQIKTKWMQACRKPESEIRQTVQQFLLTGFKSAKTKQQELAIVNRVAAIYSQLSMPADAEFCFRNLLADHPSDDVRQVFSLWLVKNEKLSNAVQVAIEGCNVQPASDASVQLLSNVLAIAASQGKRFSNAERQLEDLIRHRPENATLLYELATLKHMQGEAAAARSLYEQSIQIAPNNAFARNNLAMLLLLQPGANHDCLMQIEEALRIAGPVPEIRDTYAVVLSQQGRADESCRILRGLLSQSPKNPRYLFHLAVAYHQIDNRAASLDALKKATANHLEAESMTPEEHKLLVQLRAALVESSDSGRS